MARTVTHTTRWLTLIRQTRTLARVTLIVTRIASVAGRRKNERLAWLTLARRTRMARTGTRVTRWLAHIKQTHMPRTLARVTRMALTVTLVTRWLAHIRPTRMAHPSE